MTERNQRKTISVLVPCRNEADHIQEFLDCLSKQILPEGLEMEVLIAEGMSDDGTRELLERVRLGNLSIQVIDNPRKTVSAGLNEAIRRARGDILLRMDVHTVYAPDYVRECIRVLETSGASSVGGPARTLARTYVQKAISVAYHSPFFVGGAKFHDASYEGFVDTVPYGCWRRQTLFEVGLFDEELVRAQDCELNLRIHKKGGTVWQSSKIRSWYQPRSTLKRLSRQYFQYGYWKFRATFKHRTVPSARQAVPGICLTLGALLALLSLWSAAATWLLVVCLLMYALADGVAALTACRKADCWELLPMVTCVFPTVHLSWGFGFLAGLFDLTWSKDVRGARQHALTRSREVQASGGI